MGKKLTEIYNWSFFSLSIRTITAAVASPPDGDQQPSSRSLDTAIAVAAREVVEICDTHEKTLSIARSASLGESSGDAGVEIAAEMEAVNRLTATAKSLKEVVEILRRDVTTDGMDVLIDVPPVAGEDVVAASQKALAGVKVLAQLLASEVWERYVSLCYIVGCCCWDRVLF